MGPTHWFAQPKKSALTQAQEKLKQDQASFSRLDDQIILAKAHGQSDQVQLLTARKDELSQTIKTDQVVLRVLQHKADQEKAREAAKEGEWHPEPTIGQKVAGGVE